MFAGGLLAFGSAAIIAPVANAQPAPGPAQDCSASSVAGTVSTAAASEGAYLTANPQANEALTKIAAEPQPQSYQAYMAYFAENPQVKDQLTAIHEPVSALQDRCGVKLAPTPVAQAVWSASQQSPEVPVTPAPGVEAAMPGAPEMPTT
ncbi:hemophore-related protein [Mycolicibacterium sp. 018/SC-01/001]|nr:hemophore-related protein [Mycolicibacterium sp. 018/SC-01/001]